MTILRFIISAFSLCSAAALIVWTRFTHPGLTETQLFSLFWREYLLAVLIVLVGLWVAERHHEDAP